MSMPITPLSRKPMIEGVHFIAVDCGYLTPCLVWLKYVNNWGYGQWQEGRRRINAHVAAFVQRHGAVPEGHQVHHDCHVRSCVNWNHLAALTVTENKARQRRFRSLTGAEVRDIRDSAAPQRALADRFGVDQAVVWRVRHGLTYREVG